MARADDHWCDGGTSTRLAITSGTVSIDTHVNVDDLLIVNNDSRTSDNLYLGIFASETRRSRGERLGGLSGHHLLKVEDSHPNRDRLLLLRWVSNREPIQLDPNASVRINVRGAGLREIPDGTYWLYARVYEWNSSRPENGSRCFSAGWAFEQQATFGDGTAEDDHGDSRSSATRVALPSETAGTIDPGSDTDWFRFEVSARSEITAETTGDLDTVGTLYDADGSELAGNDDSGTLLNFHIERTLDAGTYYVRVASFGRATGSYVLHLRGGSSAPDDDHGDDYSSATRVALPSETEGVIDPGFDADWFRFEVPARTTVTVDAPGDLRLFVRLFLDGSNSFEENELFRITSTLDAGTYYVALSPAESHASPRSYVLRLRRGVAEDDHGDTRDTATRVALPSETAGVIDRRYDPDWFRFDVSARGETTMETVGVLDVVGNLYDGDGNALAYDDDSGSGDNFRIQRVLDVGTYYVRVGGQLDWNIGSYALRLAYDGSDGGGATSATGTTAAHLRNLGDFNGDGKDDVLLRHQDGRWHYYPMDGRRVLSGGGAASLTRDLAWQVAGVGDFNGDGKDDVLLRHQDGRWYFYPMDGRSILASRGTASLTTDLAWQVAGVGDFDGDGMDDVLLRHEDGGWHYYRMNGRRPLDGSGGASLTRDLAWQMAGVGDFNGDGRAEVLLRHEEGGWYFYPMNGRTILPGRGTASLTRDLAWQVAGIGDLDGDGTDDVLLRHEDGGWHYYRMNGRRPLDGSGGAALTRDLAWQVAGMGDMNGDGRVDVLMRGADSIWHYYPMDGRRVSSGDGEASLTADAAWAVAVPSAPTVTANDGLRITADARSPVQPLQAVSLTVRGGADGADYDILIDLSGTGRFEEDDTIEAAPVKSASGQLLFAAPLPETLAEGNTARRFAVRIRERAGDAEATLSNALRLTLGETDLPAELAGYPTVILDVVLKAVYEGLDDPLLAVEAGAIEPGRSVRTATALGLSTAYSDAQAEALLRSLFGVSLGASGAGGPSSPRTATAAARGLGMTSNLTSESVRCIFAPDALCNAYRRLFGCVGDALSGFGSGRESGDSLARCGQIVKEDVVEAWHDYGEKIRSAGNFLRRAAPRLARIFGVGKPPAQRIFDSNAALRHVVGLNKTLRAASELSGDARETYESMRDASKALTENTPDLIAEAERDAAEDGVDDEERVAFFDLVEEADHHYSDAAAIEELENIYTGEADVVETLGTVSDGGPATCGEGYEEFPVDDKTSTCVRSSLVEPNCYAGSRQVSHPNLGGANACLYYSLDFFQQDGSCRENYMKVRFQGRETCRWAELGTNNGAWYTLEKEHGVESPQSPQQPLPQDPQSRYYGAYALGDPVYQITSVGGWFISGTSTYADTQVEADREALESCVRSDGVPPHNCSVRARFFDGQCRVHAYSYVATKPYGEPDRYEGIHYWDIVPREQSRAKLAELDARCTARYQQLHYEGREGSCWDSSSCNP